MSQLELLATLVGMGLVIGLVPDETPTEQKATTNVVGFQPPTNE
jgi:hypothetical protein